MSRTRLPSHRDGKGGRAGAPCNMMRDGSLCTRTGEVLYMIYFALLIIRDMI